MTHTSVQLLIFHTKAAAHCLFAEFFALYLKGFFAYRMFYYPSS